jgi:hypothetical protein
MTHFSSNNRLQDRVEYLEMAQCLLSRKGYVVVLFFFIFTMITTNISAIVAATQALDSNLLFMFGKACAIEVFPHFGPICVTGDLDVTSDSPYGDVWTLSVGFVLLLVITTPLCFMNLEDNMVVQNISCAIMCLLCAEFFMQLCSEQLSTDRMPAIDLDRHAGDTVGSIMFNFALVITVPSWLNEKEPRVKIGPVVRKSVMAGTVMFIGLGLFGAMAYDLGGTSLTTYLTGRARWKFTRFCARIFAPIVLIPGLPVISIMLRYNLLENKLCSAPVANFWAIGFPFLAALFLMAGNLFNQVLAWAGLLSIIPLNFIVPGLLYLKVWRPRKALLKGTMTPGMTPPAFSPSRSYGSLSNTSRRETDDYGDNEDDARSHGSLLDPSECDPDERERRDFDDEKEDVEDLEKKPDGISVLEVNLPELLPRLSSMRRTRAYTALSWLPLERRLTLVKCIMVLMCLLNVAALIAKSREDILFFVSPVSKPHQRKNLFDAMAGLVYYH